MVLPKKLIIIIAISLLVILPLAGCFGQSRKQEPQVNSQQKSKNGDNMLVVYFSHTGNTRYVAEHIGKKTNSDVFEIKTVNTYPAEYSKVLDIAKQELRSNYRPELAADKDLADYNVIFVGYPNWWSTTPMPVLSWLEKHDLTGKTIVPFCTHGGGGIGRSTDDLKKSAPNAIFLPTFSLPGGVVKSSNSKIDEWLQEVGYQF